MISRPKANLQLIYVSDISKSTDFYKTIFKQEPVFSSPRYVAFDSGKDNFFAIWSGGIKPEVDTKRFSEIGIMLSSDDAVDNLYEEWKENPAIYIIQKPQNEVFGRTFLVQDPDGHIIRICRAD